MLTDRLGDAPEAVRYSFVVPIFRDAALAADFCEQFDRAFRDFLGLDDISGAVELLFVNDDGTRATTDELQVACDRFAFAKMIELNRNFGQHIALSAGYRYASGDYVGMLNVDQEDPPSQIPKLIAALEADPYAEMALSLRRVGKVATRRRMTSRLFNWVLNKATGYEVPLNVGTLRLMTRAAVDQLNDLPERSRFLPGLESWLGFRTIYVDTDQQPRQQGRSSYRPGRRLRMAFEAIISFSDVPLRFVVLLGMLVSAAGIVLAAILVISQLLFTNYQPGYTSTVAAVVLVGGVQIAVVGLASLYIGRVLTEVQRRPLYVVRKTYKLDAHAGPAADELSETEATL